MADEIDTKVEVVEEVETTETDVPSQEEVDYEALAKAEKKRADEAEALIIKNKKLEKRHQAEVEEAEEKPLTARDLEAFEARITQRTQKETQETRALEIARANTSSEAEAQAALTFWKNRVVPTGDIESDMKFAIGGLNHKKVLSTNSELQRALKAKSGAVTEVAGTQRDAPEAGLPKMPPADLAAYKQAGFEWDGKNKIFKKALNGGKAHIFKDHKTGRSWVA